MSLPGVYQTTLKDHTVSYRASMTHKGKHISLGSFSDEQTAHEAYLLGQLLLSNEPSAALFLHDYTASSPLAFEKWVILCNLRDNGIYFSTPIYLMKSYFSYFLDPETELKFAMDDLFYYASHKIMKRGSHLFVSDYGMQVNILSRYGIKNYGIPGKDYVFINQDIYDFRYENIHIVNSYYGVDHVNEKKQDGFRARLCLHSYYTIGYFDNALLAAIAYNKAVDIVKRNGITKNFTVNYIDEIPASKYADLYDSIKIPKKIMQLGLT